MKGCFGKFVKGALGIFGLIIVFGIVGAIINPKPATPNTGRVGTVAAPAKVAESAKAPVLVPTDTPVPLPVVGQDVQVDEVRWKILSVNDLGDKIVSDNQFIKDKTTSGKFVKVRFEVENQSKDMLSFVGLDLVDDKGRKYTRSSDTFPGVDTNETCFIENLNPNITKTCTQVYEVPKNATGLKADAGDLKMFGSADTLIDLGK